jgi:hypothetical protein
MQAGSNPPGAGEHDSALDANQVLQHAVRAQPWNRNPLAAAFERLARSECDRQRLKRQPGWRGPRGFASNIITTGSPIQTSA